MRAFLSTLTFCIFSFHCFSQKQKIVSTYLQGQYTKTISDITEGNNPWGMGLGLQALFNLHPNIRPLLEFTAHAYLMDDKVFRAYSIDGDQIPDVGGMINVFGGAAFEPTKIFYLSFAVGPSFINHRILLGIKPSVGAYFSKSQKVTGRISYIGIYNRDKRIGQDFTSYSISLGVKLF